MYNNQRNQFSAAFMNFILEVRWCWLSSRAKQMEWKLVSPWSLAYCNPPPPVLLWEVIKPKNWCCMSGRKADSWEYSKSFSFRLLQRKVKLYFPFFLKKYYQHCKLYSRSCLKSTSLEIFCFQLHLYTFAALLFTTAANCWFLGTWPWFTAVFQTLMARNKVCSITCLQSHFLLTYMNSLSSMKSFLLSSQPSFLLNRPWDRQKWERVWLQGMQRRERRGGCSSVLYGLVRQIPP